MTRLRKSEVLNKLPEPLGDMPALVVNGRFLVFGGGASDGVRDTILQIDPYTGAADPVGQMPYASRGHQVVELGAYLYLLGGFDESGTRNDLWRIDRQLQHPERLRPLPTSNAWFAALSCEDRVAVVGGYTIPGGYLGTIAFYHPEDDNWREKPDAFDPALFPKRSIGSNLVTLWNSRILSFGGSDTFNHAAGRANSRSIAAAYDLHSEHWEPLPVGAGSREGGAAARKSNMLYLLGGRGEDEEEPSPVVERVDLNTGEASVFAEMSIGRLAPAVGIIDGRILIAGGVASPLFGMTDAIEFIPLE